MTTSRPPRSRSSMFIAPAPPSASKVTLFSKIGALRRVGSFSSLSSRTPSPPATPTVAASPHMTNCDAEDTLPRDIPRSSSVMSWFSSDEEVTDSRKPWKMPKLRKKTRTAPKNSTFTFTTSASSLSSEGDALRVPLGPPLDLHSVPTLLPAVHPIELDLALDFDCAFPRPGDSYGSDPPSPPFTPSLRAYEQSQDCLESPWYPRDPRKSACWDDVGGREHEDSFRTLYTPSSSSSDSSPGPSSPRSSLRRTSRRSPEMTEEEGHRACFANDPFFGKFDDDDEPDEAGDSSRERDREVCRQLAAFRIVPMPSSSSIATGSAASQSVESLLDPHFESPSTPSPTFLHTAVFRSVPPGRATADPSDKSPSTAPLASPRPNVNDFRSFSSSSPRLRTKTSFSFPLPPTMTTKSSSSMGNNNPSTTSFLGLEIEEDDDSPWFDCNP